MIKITRLADKNFEVKVDFTVLLTEKELYAYTLSSSCAHVVIERIKKEYTKLEKEFRKTGEKLIQSLKS